MTFLVDGGANTSCTGARTLFVGHLRPMKGILEVANGGSMAATHTGTIEIPLRTANGQQRTFSIPDVLFVPAMTRNLLAPSQIPSTRIVQETDALKHVVEATLTDTRSGEVWNLDVLNGLLHLKPGTQAQSAKAYRASMVGRTLDMGASPSLPELHVRFGHTPARVLIRMVKEGQIPGVHPGPWLQTPMPACTSCLQNQKRSPFTGHLPLSNVPLGRVSADIFGPTAVKTLDGHSYEMVLVDDNTAMTWSYGLHLKSEALSRFTEWVAHVEKQFNAKVGAILPMSGTMPTASLPTRELLAFRSDNGGEFTSEAFTQYLASKGIKREATVPYSSQLNPRAERMIGVITEKVRVLLIDSGLPLNLWGQAWAWSTHLRNRLPNSSRSGLRTSPLEAWTGEKPDLSTVERFGARVYAWLPENRRPHGKLGVQAIESRFVGIDEATGAYLLYDPRTRKVYTSRDLKVIDRGPRILSLGEELAAGLGRTPAAVTTTRDPPLPLSPLPPACSTTERGRSQERETPRARTHPSRTRERPLPAGANAHTHWQQQRAAEIRAGLVSGWGYGIEDGHAVNVAIVGAPPGVPKTVETALAHPQFRAAIEKEMAGMKTQGVWQLIPPDKVPRGTRVLPGKAIFSQKIGTNGAPLPAGQKCRIVVGGHRQAKTGQFASQVVNRETLFIMLTLAVQHGWHAHVVDAIQAFLNADIDEPTYMRQPKGLEVPGCETHIYELFKALYGLRQSPRLWAQHLTKLLRALGFRRSRHDSMLFIRGKGAKAIYVLAHVDDLLILSPSASEIATFKKELARKIAIKDLGPLEAYTKLRMDYNREGGELRIELTGYTANMLEQFADEDAQLPARSLPTMPLAQLYLPAESAAETKEFAAKPFREAVGALQYLAQHTRPDLLVAVNHVASRVSQPTARLWKYLMDIMRFVRATAGTALVIRRVEGPLKLNVFVDSDFANDPDTRRSIYGVASMLGSSAVCCLSRKSQHISVGSMEAEIVAVSHGAKDAVFVQRLLADVGHPLKSIPTLWCDNAAAVQFSDHPIKHHATKHIDVSYLYAREQVEDGVLSVKWIPGTRNRADILTKRLGGEQFKRCADALGLQPIPAKGSVDVAGAGARV